MTLEALEDEGVSPGEPRGVGRGEKSQVWGLRTLSAFRMADIWCADGAAAHVGSKGGL